MITVYKYTCKTNLGALIADESSIAWLQAYASGACSCEADVARILSLTIRRDSITFESHDEFSSARVEELTDSLLAASSKRQQSA